MQISALSSCLESFTLFADWSFVLGGGAAAAAAHARPVISGFLAGGFFSMWSCFTAALVKNWVKSWVLQFVHASRVDGVCFCNFELKGSG